MSSLLVPPRQFPTWLRFMQGLFSFSFSLSYSYIPLLSDALEILLEYDDSDDDAMEIWCLEN